MNDDQREQVSNNARYLRNVRPIDPEEICEYVTEQPHPAAIRQVLREQIFDLGIIERDDGTFVPVATDDDPVKISFHGVDRVPPDHISSLETLLTERYGPDWNTGTSGDRLRETIRQFKQEYFDQESVEYDDETALAYAIYHLPDYYAVAQYAFAALMQDGLVSHELRILDVGAGVGGPALGICDFLPDECLVEYHAVEPSAAADVFDTLVNGSGRKRNQSVTLFRQSAEEFEPEGEYDLVLFANVLSELAHPVEVAERYLSHLAPDGTCLMLAPADQNTAIGLRTVERVLADENSEIEEKEQYTVSAPTVRLWPDQTPADRGWSFDVKPDIAVPSVQRRLDEAATATAVSDTDSDHEPGEFVNVDVQYAYSVLRRDDRQRIEFIPDSSRFAPMADSEIHVSERIDLVAIKLSHDIGGDNPLFKIGDGSEQVDHYAVLARESGLNRDLVQAEYGTLLVFENALVLWNDDERAYNIVVDGETIVDSVVE
jgi:2-polyprenyl-3-methyl-5-hydroxy-6-metoxy-1,4-benzoquinol methylase